MRGILKSLRRAVLPSGTACRRIPLGLARGLRFNVDFHYDTAFYFGQYERELNGAFRALVRPGDRCFDVGGYRGWTGLAMARLAGAAVVVFESNAPNVEVIRANAARNGMEVTVEHVLVGGRDGEGWTTLDRAASEHFVPDFIKMDIEGGEVDALRGAERILAERGPAMIVEVHGRDREAACLAILERHGYQPAVVDQRRRVLQERRGREDNRWLVCPGRERDP